MEQPRSFSSGLFLTPAVSKRCSANTSRVSVCAELRSEDVEVVRDPLEDVKPGLLDASGQQIPLQAVHVKCRLMDLLCQVLVEPSRGSYLQVSPPSELSC